MSIVDDNKDMLELLTNMLTRNGVKVSAFSNLNEVIEAYKFGREEIDLMICDMQMPNMDGISLLREIEEFSRQHRPKTVNISGGVALDSLNEKKANPNLVMR